MRIRTGALAVLVAAVVRTAFCVDTTSLAASAPSGGAARAWPAPDRTATPNSAEPIGWASQTADASVSSGYEECGCHERCFLRPDSPS